MDTTARDSLYAFHAAHPDVANADGEQFLKLPTALLDEHDELLAAATSELTYAQAVTRLAREYRSCIAGGKLISSADYVRIIEQLHAAADAAGIDRPVAARDLFDEINAEPVA